MTTMSYDYDYDDVVMMIMMMMLMMMEWVILGAAGRILGPLGALLGPLGRILGGSWEHFGSIWGGILSYFGAWEASFTRFAEILKNHEKHCKVLQKSRLGEAEISEKYAWGLQVGLSDWLWTAKLTSGDALGLQVELPKALGAAK